MATTQTRRRPCRGGPLAPFLSSVLLLMLLLLPHSPLSRPADGARLHDARTRRRRPRHGEDATPETASAAHDRGHDHHHLSPLLAALGQSARDVVITAVAAASPSDAVTLALTKARAEAGPHAGPGRDRFELPDCTQSPWGRIAVFLSFRGGHLPSIGSYNHVTLVLAPATPAALRGGPRAVADMAFVHELVGTATEFLVHSTLKGRSIAVPKTNRLDRHPDANSPHTHFLYVGHVECAPNSGEKEGEEEEDETDQGTDQQLQQQQRYAAWRAWEAASGVAFPTNWAEAMLALRRVHDAVRHEQRRNGIPFKAAFRALFPKSKEAPGSQNHKRYNFATYNCAHYARELLTEALGLPDADAQQLIMDDLRAYDFPKHWHAHFPFSIVNPKTTDRFLREAGLEGRAAPAYPRQPGVAPVEWVHTRMRCVPTPDEQEEDRQGEGQGEGEEGGHNNRHLRHNHHHRFGCLRAEQEAGYENGPDDAGTMEVEGGYRQFFLEHYGSVWVQAAGSDAAALALRGKLAKLLAAHGGDGDKAGELASPMGQLVRFHNLPPTGASQR